MRCYDLCGMKLLCLSRPKPFRIRFVSACQACEEPMELTLRVPETGCELDHTSSWTCPKCRRANVLAALEWNRIRASSYFH